MISVVGSSPLARGLLPGAACHWHGRGIIPARAGFTPTEEESWGGCTDHPRSRGVYSGRRRRIGVTCGSSPLARGLHFCPPVVDSLDGIIPARAGFTTSASGPPASAAGSSPLARGLRLPVARRLRQDRIIPARAGFTHEPDGGPVELKDHPRSRGVYRISSKPVYSSEGSSPLARGLPHEDLEAGRRAVDHPRSRGVYWSRSTMSPAADGSSPLARGLRVGRGDHVVQSRIIPARAGFTGAGPPCRPPPMDHPRSRGVYTFQQAEITGYEGSSPLARGLQQGSLGLGERPWIIPARAGFTQLWRFRRRRHRIIPARAGFTNRYTAAERRHKDHPRSRGVYTTTVPFTYRDGGSSPLARGLRKRDREHEIRERIIPARAGFTIEGRGPEIASEDHPRSRGVYPVVTYCRM